MYFGGAASYACSRDNRMTRNVVTESRRFAVHGSYKQGAPVGSGNLVLDNCVWRTARMGGNGYTAARNRVVDPRVVPVARGYRLLPAARARATTPGPRASDVRAVDAVAERDHRAVAPRRHVHAPHQRAHHRKAAPAVVLGAPIRQRPSS